MANGMHRHGLDERPRKNLAFFTSESGSPKKWCSIAQENSRKEGYARFGARLTFKMDGKGREANLMHRQGLDGRPQKNWHFLHRNLDHPKNGLL